MKKLIVISVVLLLSFGPAVSKAAKCKWRTDTVNYRTGEPVRWTRWVRNRTILRPPYAAIAGVSEGERKFLGLQVIAVEQTLKSRPTKNELDALFVIPAGSKLLISMADGSIYELVSTVDVIGDADMKTEDDMFADSGPKARGDSGYTISAFGTIKFPLDDDAITALTAQRASEMRLNANGEEYHFSFGKKPVDKIQKTILCIQ